MRRRSNTEQLERTLPQPSPNVIRSRSFSHSQSPRCTRESQHAMQAVGTNNLLVRSALRGQRGSPRMVRSFSEDVANFFRRFRPSRNRKISTPSSSSVPQVRGVRLQFETDHLMRKRSDSSRFFCAVCGVAYVRKQDLRQHILRLHSIGSRSDGGLPLTHKNCPYCRIVLDSREALNAHTRIVHHECFNCRQKTVMSVRGNICPECKE